MKLTARVQLHTTDEQSELLIATMRKANELCNRLSKHAWEHRVFGKYALQEQCYHSIGKESGLASQLIIRCLAKVADGYRSAFALHKQRTADTIELNKRLVAKGKPIKPLPVMEAVKFKPLGAVPFDSRILTWQTDKEAVSIWSMSGRLKMAFSATEYHQNLLARRQGEADLVSINGKFFLLPTVGIDDPALIECDGFIGVDLGLAEIATTSSGKSFSGKHIKVVRKRNRGHRRQVQKKRTRSAYKRLQTIGRRVSRFGRNTNHVISKLLVQDALSSAKALALEDLSGIRESANGFSRELRWQLGNWSFFQLRQFLSYKARMAGISIVFVDPAYTSATCSSCGHCDKGNRKSQAGFQCLSCGLCLNADANASLNIAQKAMDSIQHRVLLPDCIVAKARASSECLMFHAQASA